MGTPAQRCLYVLLASEAPVGLVLCREGSKRVAAYAWDRRNDTFEAGQFLSGRIYESRCDLSPDGESWVYFAADFIQDSRRRRDFPTWSAVARVPFFTALLVAPGIGTWGGGGYWTPKGKLSWNGGGRPGSVKGVAFVAEDDPIEWVRGLDPHPELRKEGRWGLGASVLRRIRCGWRVEHVEIHGDEDQPATCWRTLDLARDLPDGFVLRRDWSREKRREVFWVEAASGRTVVDDPDWEWADLDGRRLVWSVGPALYAGHVDDNGLWKVRLLKDFSEDVFESRSAPYPAARPLET
jgi:hypothetical protein